MPHLLLEQAPTPNLLYGCVFEWVCFDVHSGAAGPFAQFAVTLCHLVQSTQCASRR